MKEILVGCLFLLIPEFSDSATPQPGGWISIHVDDLLDSLAWIPIDEAKELRLPLIGIVSLENVSLNTLSAELDERFSEYIASPEVKVKYIGPEEAEEKISNGIVPVGVFGEVAFPGFYWTTVGSHPFDVYQKAVPRTFRQTTQRISLTRESAGEPTVEGLSPLDLKSETAILIEGKDVFIVSRRWE